MSLGHAAPVTPSRASVCSRYSLGEPVSCTRFAVGIERREHLVDPRWKFRERKRTAGTEADCQRPPGRDILSPYLPAHQADNNEAANAPTWYGAVFMSEYWVYENWTVKRARVHLAGCGNCNHGRGKQQTDSGRNGRWYGPFADRDAAFRRMEHTSQPDRRACGYCSP